MIHLPITCSMEPWDASVDTSCPPMQRDLVLSRMGRGYGRSQGSPQTHKDVKVSVYASLNLQP